MAGGLLGERLGDEEEITRIARQFQDNPEPWLLDGLRRTVAKLRYPDVHCRDAPAPRQLRAQLQKIAKLTSELAELIDGPDCAPILLALSERDEVMRDAPELGLGGRLRDLEERAEEAAERIKVHRGARRRVPPQLGHGRPEELCMAFVVKAWCFTKGRAPGPNNRGAIKAAEEIWTLSGREHSGAWRAGVSASVGCNDGWNWWLRKIAANHATIANDTPQDGDELAD